MSENVFKATKDMVLRSHQLLWVNIVSPDDDNYPCYSLASGFLRTLGSEAIERHIVTLSIECGMTGVEASTHIASVCRSSFELGSPEPEYMVRDGIILTGRLYEKASLAQDVDSLIAPRPKEESWLPGPPLKLVFGTPGSLDTFHFIDDSPLDELTLGPDDVVIEARAWGLSFRDIMTALGRLDMGDLGFDGSGIVTRVGSSCSNLEPGDRVSFMSPSSMKMYPRSINSMVSRIPDSMSFEAAASILCPGVTAYYALIELARLRKGEKVLIHSAMGATGTMAVQIAQMVGAEVFATVGRPEKKKRLMEVFGIPEDHIFDSRNTTFEQGVMRVTGGKGVGVVLNSLAGEGLRASLRCIAPFGRFVEIGKADIMADSNLPMAQFAKNVSFVAVDVQHLCCTDSDLSQRMIQKVMSLVERGDIQPPGPLNVYSLSAVESAFRAMQEGNCVGRIVVSVDPNQVVEVSVSR